MNYALNFLVICSLLTVSNQASCTPDDASKIVTEFLNKNIDAYIQNQDNYYSEAHKLLEKIKSFAKKNRINEAIILLELKAEIKQRAEQHLLKTARCFYKWKSKNLTFNQKYPHLIRNVAISAAITASIGLLTYLLFLNKKKFDDINKEYKLIQEEMENKFKEKGFTRQTTFSNHPIHTNEELSNHLSQWPILGDWKITYFEGKDPLYAIQIRKEIDEQKAIYETKKAALRDYDYPLEVTRTLAMVITPSAWFLTLVDALDQHKELEKKVEQEYLPYQTLKEQCKRILHLQKEVNDRIKHLSQ